MVADAFWVPQFAGCSHVKGLLEGLKGVSKGFEWVSEEPGWIPRPKATFKGEMINAARGEFGTL